MDILNNIYQATIKPRAILFVETKFSNFKKTINDYLKSLVCSSKHFCNQCEMCKKIDNHSYNDLIILDGTKSTIKKEDVLKIQETFFQSGLEICNKKIYVIYCIENATKETLNSLLKFMEQPPIDTYAILTTRNINKVLPTIKSRCQVYNIPGNEKEFRNQLVSKYHLPEDQLNVVINSYYNIDEFDDDYQSQKFINLYCFINELKKAPNDLHNIKELSVKFKEFDYVDIAKIYTFASCFIHKNKEVIINTLNKLKFNPTKILLFNQLWELIRNN